MKSMKISAVVLGLAVAGVFAQEAAPAAAAEAQPAAEQPAAPAAPAVAPAAEAAPAHCVLPAGAGEEETQERIEGVVFR